MIVRWLEVISGRLGEPSTVQIGTAKAQLVAWNLTDGGNSLLGYGMMPEDLTPSWTGRDVKALNSFVEWWNERQQSHQLGEALLLTDAHVQALNIWAAGKASTGLPPGVTLPPISVPAIPTAPPGTQPALPPPPTSIASKSVEPPRKKSNLGWWIVGGSVIGLVFIGALGQRRMSRP